MKGVEKEVIRAETFKEGFPKDLGVEDIWTLATVDAEYTVSSPTSWCVGCWDACSTAVVSLDGSVGVVGGQRDRRFRDDSVLLGLA